jgi:hypothetical protein
VTNYQRAFCFYIGSLAGSPTGSHDQKKIAFFKKQGTTN